MQMFGTAQRTPNGPELVSTPDGIGKAQIDGQIFRDMLISLLDLFARSCSFFFLNGLILLFLLISNKKGITLLCSKQIS